MTVRSKSDYTTTIGTAITLQQEKGVEAIEKSLNKSMAPNFIMVANRASCRSFPYIFSSLLKYFLENNRNKGYHLFQFPCWVSLDPFVWGGEVRQKLHRPFFCHKKKAARRRPINLRIRLNCQAILKNKRLSLFKHCTTQQWASSLHQVLSLSPSYLHKLPFLHDITVYKSRSNRASYLFSGNFIQNRCGRFLVTATDHPFTAPSRIIFTISLQLVA